MIDSKEKRNDDAPMSGVLSYQRNRISYLGCVFGRLTVLEEVAPRVSQKGYVQRLVLCECTCGSSKVIGLKNITRGLTSSCGCLHREVTSSVKTTHGLSKSRTYKSWCGLVARGTGKSNIRNYGSRGIAVCNRWLKFENFLHDMGEAPEGASIDRINNNGGYMKSNCRWADTKVQGRNTRRNRRVTYRGREMCLQELSDMCGVLRSTLAFRLNSGWSVTDAAETPVKPPRTIIHDGVCGGLTEMASKHGLCKATLVSRLRLGWAVRDALETPSKLRKP